MKDERENFLARWSRRKGDARAESSDVIHEESEQASSTTSSDHEGLPTDQGTIDRQEVESNVLAELPSIDSITAETDIRAFLKPGVPADLSRAALRRAWSSDPAIRDFVGLVENGWDFNNPDAVPGFGTISVEEAAQLVTQTFGGHDGEKKRNEKVEEQQSAQSCGVSSPANVADPVPDPPDEVAEHDVRSVTENVAVQETHNVTQNNSDS
ncbi:MAG: hypothetical protein OJF62_000517 [Pseudolabrys sp.]|nr:hypothetical protein [Pseudolabrys sp.]